VDKWAAVCSDITNVTKATWKNISTENPTILDLNDAIHHLQNTIGDITKLDEFKSVSAVHLLACLCLTTGQFVSLLKGIIKYFSKSTYGTNMLCEE
jgi:endoglucanase Acf2